MYMYVSDDLRDDHARWKRDLWKINFYALSDRNFISSEILVD